MRPGHKLLTLLVLSVGASAQASDGAHPPHPASDLAEAFSADNYPAEAIRANEQGHVRALVAVNARGTATGCTIDQSSGSKSLDATTCDLAVRRGTYSPATDDHGNAVAGIYTLNMRWVIPPNQLYQPILLSGTAEAPACTVVIDHRLRSLLPEFCRTVFDRFRALATPGMDTGTRLPDLDIQPVAVVAANLVPE